MVPQFFKNPDPAVPVPKVVAPEQLQVRDDAYYDTLNDALVAPSQDDIEEQQDFLATIYKVIEEKLAEEEGIYLASDAEVSDDKWQLLAPDVDLPAADIISQEWAQTHTHSEFLREQAKLNNIAAASWRFWWSANPPDRSLYPDLYAEWSKIEDYCQVTTQTWYNIRFKELKEDSAKALGLDPTTFKKITTSTEWLADEFEKAGTDPTYAAQQATARAESVLSLKQPSRVNTPVPIPSPKPRSRSADAVMRSHPSTPENKESIDIRTPMPRKIKEKLESIPSDITSLEYIDELAVKEEPTSPTDVEMSTVIVNPAPIRHRIQTELVVEMKKSDTVDTSKGKQKESVTMDTMEDFAPEKEHKDTTASSSTNNDIKYHSAPSTLTPKIQEFTKDVECGTGKSRITWSHTLLRVMSNGKELLDFMDIAKKNLTRADQVEFHKELDKKGYAPHSTYLEVLLNSLFNQAVDMELHQGHYHPIKEVYNNFNDPLEKFEDQIESVEKDGILFAILPYELYGDLLVHWLVTRKYIRKAIDHPGDRSMEKITWSYLNTLFDHRFKDTLSEADFLQAVKGLHYILDESVQGKYDMESFGKSGIDASMHTPKTVYVEKEKINHNNLHYYNNEE
ncbi:hypothetical protein AX15_006529 [Amanita polypyramis BW_CC]|nr:hypothetical protein AX15_006529 [Amanita polypyramis BW_CC]